MRVIRFHTCACRFLLRLSDLCNYCANNKKNRLLNTPWIRKYLKLMKIKLTKQSSRGTGQYILPGNRTLSGQQIELMLTIIVNGPHKFCQYSARSAFGEGKKSILNPKKPMGLIRHVTGNHFKGPPFHSTVWSTASC